MQFHSKFLTATPGTKQNYLTPAMQEENPIHTFKSTCNRQYIDRVINQNGARGFFFLPETVATHECVTCENSGSGPDRWTPVQQSNKAAEDTWDWPLIATLITFM